MKVTVEIEFDPQQLTIFDALRELSEKDGVEEVDLTGVDPSSF